MPKPIADTRSLTEQVRRTEQPRDGAELTELSKQAKEVDKNISSLMSAIEQTDTPGPLLRRVGELENERAEILDRLDRLKEETRQAKALSPIKESTYGVFDALAEGMEA